MILKIISTALAATYICVAANTLYAQSYTLSPGDSIAELVLFEDLSVFNILQQNNLSDTLFLSWEKVSTDVPDLWLAAICDNSNCYPDLIQNGNMLPVVTGEYGLLSIHITAHTNSGTAVIRYAVWETNLPLIVDTLTWSISTGITAIENQMPEPTGLLINDNQLIFQNLNANHQTVIVTDLQGRILLEQQISSTYAVVNLPDFSPGIYLVNVIGAHSMITHKIFLHP